MDKSLVFHRCVHGTIKTTDLTFPQILIVYIILFGTASPLELNYSEYVTVLSLMGFTTGVTLFCWIVVFTFRKNLLMIAKYSITPTGKYIYLNIEIFLKHLFI